MTKSERATFVVTTDGTDKEGFGDGKPPRRLEYDISLDDWTEEIDLSECKDRSLLKLIMRDGSGTAQPVDVASVTLRCDSIGDADPSLSLVSCRLFPCFIPLLKHSVLRHGFVLTRSDVAG